MRGLLDKRLEKELRRALEKRINRAEVRMVARVFIAIPERHGEPRATGRPEPPLWAVNRGGRTPEIGVVMHHPPAGSVHLARGPCAGHRQILHERRQRVHRLLEIRGERGPVAVSYTHLTL